MGGEEFCICFYNRNEDEVKELLEYIRKDFEKNVIEIKDIQLKYTISIGCSFDFGINIDEMIKNADEYLYEAKKDGRNIIKTNESRFTQPYNTL